MTVDKEERMGSGIDDAARAARHVVSDVFSVSDDDLCSGSFSAASEWSYSTGGRSTRSTLLPSSLGRTSNGRNDNPGGDTPVYHHQHEHHHHQQQQPPSSISSTDTHKTSSSCTCL